MTEELPVMGEKAFVGRAILNESVFHFSGGPRKAHALSINLEMVRLQSQPSWRPTAVGMTLSLVWCSAGGM